MPAFPPEISEFPIAFLVSALMMPDFDSSAETIANALRDRASLVPVRFTSSARRTLVIVLSLATIFTGGCGDDTLKQQAAYQEAVATVERERAALKGIRSEAERVFGEYQLHNIEGRIIGGEFSPRRALGLLIGEDAYGNRKNLYGYLFHRLPLPWTWQIDRLLTDRADSLPWYDRTQGEVYRRRVRDRYAQLLVDLRDRVALQTERVKHAEDYARLLKPGEAK